ncbi:MAG: PKD domain-containing protein [Phycisphaerales bacterium]
MSLQRAVLTFATLSALSLTTASGEPDTVIIPKPAPAQAEPAAQPSADSAGPLSLADRWSRKDAAKCDVTQHLNPLLAAALDKYAKPFPDPQAKKREVIEKIKYSPACYYAATQEDFDRLVRMYDLMPASLLGEERFVSATTVFVGDGGVVPNASGRAQPINLTISYPADGTTWGTGSGFGTGPNVLRNRMDGFFGNANADRAYELIRQAFGSWRRNGGITYTEVLDDNSPETTATGRSNFRGDVRIGSYFLDGFFNVLAYNNFTSSGSDMNFDSGDFAGGSFYDSTDAFRFFRNVTAHEHGHGMSYIHSVPCNDTKLMEPQASTGFEMVANDDRRGIQRNYGDRLADNNSPAAATDFGNLTSPILTSIIERDLSTNSATGFDNSDEDWFRFTLGSTQNIVITVDPTGGVYTTGQQSGGCSGTTASVNADQAGNLNIELRDSAGAVVIQTAATSAAGVNEVLTRNGVPAGTYTVRVFDVGPNATVNQFLQTYDLTLNVGGATAPPQAIAGINKRIGQGLVCWFRGDLNSRAVQPGAGISSYQWDFTNDGTFDASGAEVSTIYATAGLRTVRLRVTDTNGRIDDDTITVNVFDNTPPPPPGSCNLLTPANGAVITDLAPTFDWTDATNIESYTLTVDDNADFSSPLFTVSVTASEAFTSFGTFSENVTYFWKVLAVNPFGSTPATPTSFSFRINTTPPPACPGDFDGDGQRNTVDLVTFLSFFGTTQPPNTNGDLDGNGLVNTVDLVTFLAVFGVPCP